jgi:hypothetical protein
MAFTDFHGIHRFPWHSQISMAFTDFHGRDTGSSDRGEGGQNEAHFYTDLFAQTVETRGKKNSAEKTGGLNFFPETF